MTITKTTVRRGSFVERVWSNLSCGDIDLRKKQPAQAVWEECFSGGCFYLNILFFRSYRLAFWNPRVARHKKVYQNDVPAVVSAAEFRSEDAEIFADDTEIVCAADVAMPCTHERFLAAWRLLHESRNLHLATVNRSKDFIPLKYWKGIFLCTRELDTCIVDRAVAEIFDALPTDVQILWTGGFFDDADICCSVFARDGGPDSAESPPENVRETLKSPPENV